MSTATTPDPARFVREARALAAEEVVPLRADPALAARNVKAGATAVLTYEAHITEHLRGVDLNELRTLPALAAQVVEAAKEVAGEEGAETAALATEALALATRLRAAALALVESGVLAPREVSKVMKDRGPLDPGAACGALATLFQKRAEEIEGKSPIDEAAIARAEEIAPELRARQKVKAAHKKPGPLGISPVELRDRLWTLLAMRHERLWAVGAYIYGHAVDEHVPRLLATPRVVTAIPTSKSGEFPRKVSEGD